VPEWDDYKKYSHGARTLPSHKLEKKKSRVDHDILTTASALVISVLRSHFGFEPAELIINTRLIY
jgi:hypothetical protein